MSTCVEKIEHECGSSDGCQVFQDEDTGEYTAYCFACDTFVRDPYHDKPANYVPAPPIKKTAEEVAEELREIGECDAKPVRERALNGPTLEAFGCTVEVSAVDGVTPVTVYFPARQGGKVTGYKARLLAEKRMWCVGSMADVDLFGWHLATQSGAKRLYITEGEYDALALWQALVDRNRGTEYERFRPAVVSLTRGAGHTAKELARHADAIRRNFKEVVLVFDQDEAGQRAEAEAQRVLPEALSVSLPAKDANACLVEGREKALCNAALFGAAHPKQTRIVSASDYFEEASTPPEWGLDWPWSGLTDLTRGIRTGETIYIGAGVKMGKSTIANILAAHYIQTLNMPIYYASPESSIPRDIKRVAGKMVGRVFHDPKREFDRDAFMQATRIMDNKLFFMDLFQVMGWDDLKSDIRQAVHRHGARAVFIDPITNLTTGMSAADANVQLHEMAQELSVIAKDEDITVFIFCHLKAPENGKPHERGGPVMSHQFAGSRAMMRSCNLMLGLEGNKDPDTDLSEQRVRKLIVLEDREFGASDYVRLWQDPDNSTTS
jgi:twinkle protein